MADSFDVTISADASGLVDAMAAARAAADSAGQSYQFFADQADKSFAEAGASIVDFSGTVTQSLAAATAANDAWRASAGMGVPTINAIGGGVQQTAASFANFVANTNAAGIAMGPLTAAATQAAAAMGAGGGAGMAAGAQAAGAAMGPMGGAMAGAAAQAQNLGKHIDYARMAIRAFWEAWSVVFAAQFIAKSLQEPINQFMALTEQIRITAAVLNSSASEAHAWINAAQASGMKAQDFTTLIRTMDSQVASGGKTLHQMGIEIRDSVTGQLKSAGELIQETMRKLETYTDSIQRNVDSQKVFGRSWEDLSAHAKEFLSNLEEQKASLADNEQQELQNQRETDQLKASYARMNQEWMSIVQTAGPAMVTIIGKIAESMIQLANEANIAAASIASVFQMASGVGKTIGGAIDSLGGAIDKLTGTDKINKKLGFDEAADGAKKLSDGLETLHNGYVRFDTVVTATRAKNAADIAAFRASQGAIGAGAYELPGITVEGEAPPATAPKGGGGRGKKGGGADPMQGLDNALEESEAKFQRAKATMDTLMKDLSRDGSTAFKSLEADAQTAFDKMIAAHKKFDDAVQSGDKNAATLSKSAWQDAFTQFEKASQKAAEQFKKDEEAKQQAAKKTADAIASEFSSAFNQILSGQFNLRNEFIKIMEQMTSAVIKHVAEWIAQQLMGSAVEKATTKSSVMSEAGSGAAAAWASAAKIPYIGWLLGPLAGAAAYAGIMAFAAQGYDVPPGTNPLTQLHGQEMVLPAVHAETIRNLGRMATGAGSGAVGGGQSLNQTFNIQSLDPSSLATIVARNPDIFAGAGARALRGGYTAYTG